MFLVERVRNVLASRGKGQSLKVRVQKRGTNVRPGESWSWEVGFVEKVRAAARALP